MKGSINFLSIIMIVEEIKANNKKEKEILCQRAINKKLTNTDKKYDLNFG